MPKPTITAYFHFFDIVGRQPNCYLKSKNPSALEAFGAEQFESSRFFLEQGTKSKPY